MAATLLSKVQHTADTNKHSFAKFSPIVNEMLILVWKSKGTWTLSGSLRNCVSTLLIEVDSCY